eukprot:g554.t1
MPVVVPGGAFGAFASALVFSLTCSDTLGRSEALLVANAGDGAIAAEAGTGPPGHRQELTAEDVQAAAVAEPQSGAMLDGAKMVPLSVPTSDFSATPDDLWFCRERHFCYHNGRCDRETGTCLCEHPWQGAECDQGVLQANRSGNTVLISRLDSAYSPRDDRADGNQLFLAKAHHRLRQVVAELSLLGEPDEALVREKFKLMKSLGLQYTHPGVRAHERTLNLDPARLAARNPSSRRLPAVVTMRWSNPVPDDNIIQNTVQESMRQALSGMLHSVNKSAAEESGPVAVDETRTRFGVFSHDSKDLEKRTSQSLADEISNAHEDVAPKRNFLNFESPPSKDAPVRNIEHEGPWDLNPEQPFAVNVNEEHTDMIPGLKLIYPGVSDRSQRVAVNPGDDPIAMNKLISTMTKLKMEHEQKEAALTGALALETSAEGVPDDQNQ